MRRLSPVSRPAVRHRGSAIISVLVVLALCTLVISGLFSREFVTLRSVENRASLSQIRWMERAVLDWVRVALRFDAMNDARQQKISDECTEPWTVLVERETQLDETTTGGIALSTPEQPAIISGQVRDAQARFNLNNLIDVSREPLVTISARQVEAFKRLLNQLQLAEGLADTLSAHLLLTRPRKQGEAMLAATRARMIFVEELQSLPGFTPEVMRKLERFVMFLPGFTTVNVNFAEPEVLAAVVSGLGMADARRLSQASQCRQPINSVAKIGEVIGGTTPYDLTLLDVKSDYFLVEGNVRYDRMEVKTEALLRRERGSNQVVVEWQQRK